MTWPGQVVHVAWKDLRQFRGAVAVYGLLVATVTVAALTGVPAARNGFVTDWVVLAAVVALVGLITQADSPSHVDAFWATRPFYPSAVLSAKVLTTALMVGLACAAELGVLLAYDTPPELRWGMLGFSLLVTMVLLSTTWAIAAMTTRFWQYLVFVVSCLAAQGGLAILELRGAPLRHAVGPWDTASGLAVLVLHRGLMGGPLALVVMPVTLALTWYAYRARSTVRARFATSGILLLVLGTSLAFRAAPAVVASVAIPSAFPPLTIRPVSMKWKPDDPLAVIQLSMSGIPANAAYRMDSADARLIRVDGSSVPLHTIAISEFESHPSSERPVTWLGRPLLYFNGVVGFRLTQDQMDAFLQPGARVEVHGWVDVDTARLVARFPLVLGTTFTRDGRRFTVLRLGFGPSKLRDLARVPSITVREVNTHPRESIPWEGHDVETPRFVIVNPARGQGAVISEQKETDDLALPLPAGSVTVSLVDCEPAEDPPGLGNPPSPIDEGWIRGAHMEVFKWVSVGGYPVTFTADASLLTRAPTLGRVQPPSP